MKVIGITGGVGAGKTEVLKLIEELSNCYIIRSDELAKSLEKKGEVCYLPIVELLGSGILGEDGEIIPSLMAKAIFEDASDDNLKRVNDIIHPKVKERICQLIAENDGKYDYFFIEAALLIEEHYELICDELWYIYADRDIREKRLIDSRGYSIDKINGIMDSQLDDETFRKYCKNVVNNGGTLDDTRRQLISIFDKERA